MADDTLQIRRDLAGNIIASSVGVDLAEPVYDPTEQRLWMGRKSRDVLGAPLMGTPLREGLQHKVLWAMGRYGGSAGAFIGPRGGSEAYDLDYGYAYSGSFMEDEMRDSVAVEIWADGTYLADSPDPRLLWDLTWGSDVTGPTAIRPEGGAVEVSYRRNGANCLGLEYQERLGWRLHVVAHFFGADGEGKMDPNGNPGRVRVSWELDWGPRLTSTEAFGSGVGPVQGGFSKFWRANHSFAKGETVYHSGEYVRAVGPVTGAPQVPNSGSTADLTSWLVARSGVTDSQEPGNGNRWREYWAPLRQRMSGNYERSIGLTGLGNTLSLRFAGPYQADAGVFGGTWDGTGSGDWDPESTDDNNRVVLDEVRFWTPRFKISKNGAPKPSTNPRHWREISFLRGDEMICDSSVAVVHGGRIGVADRNMI